MQNCNEIKWGIHLCLIAVMMAMVAATTGAIDEVTPTPDPTVDVEALVEQAVTALQNGDAEEGLALLEQALLADPGNAEIYAIQGIAHVTFDDLDAAIESFNQAIELTPYNTIYLSLRADTYVLIGDWGNVLADYTAIIALNPRDSDAFLGRAEAYTELGDADAAELDELVSECILNWQFGESDGALEACGVVVDSGETTDTVAAAHYLRGMIQFGRDNLDVAFDELTTAISIEPDMHDAYLARGINARQNDDLPQAGRDFVRRMEIIERERFEQTIDYGDAVLIDMDYGYTYAIQFEAATDDVLTITARSEEELAVDPLIALLDPSGTPIAGDDDFGGGLDSQLNRLTVSETGTYTLLVGHANGGFLGTVRVTFGAENTAMIAD